MQVECVFMCVCVCVCVFTVISRFPVPTEHCTLEPIM